MDLITLSLQIPLPILALLLFVTLALSGKDAGVTQPATDRPSAPAVSDGATDAIWLQ